jgi:hypothetical protein
MDDKVRPGTGGSQELSDYDGPEWHWWHNVLGLVIVLAAVVVMSWWPGT